MEEPERFKRRLAAVLVADVAGYSRLMQLDEVGTHRRWQTCLAAAERLSASHGGRWVKATGDGFIVEFPSLVEAVSAALAIQQDIRAVEAEQPEPSRVRLRIGLHFGDLIVGGATGADLFGDGINIAARLEPLAPPGGICVTDATRLALKGKLDIAFTDAGTRRLKNIEEPVRLWMIGAEKPAWSRRRHVRLAGFAVAAVAVLTGALVVAPKLLPGRGKSTAGLVENYPAPVAGNTAQKLSIVVLPFENGSGDPTNDIYADAITEDLITDLSRIADAFVISSNTSFTFKGKSFDAREVAKQLNVQFAVLGKVRRTGEELSISASLIDGQSGGILWSKRFVRTRADMYAFQQEVTGQIARTLNLELKQAASEKAARGAPRDLDAQDFALRAWTEIWNRPQSAATNAAGLALVDKALAIEPSNPDALATRSYALTRAAQFGWSDRSVGDLIRDAISTGERAVALDPRNADAFYALQYALRVGGDIDRSERLLQTAIALNENHAPSYGALGLRQILAGQPEQSHALLARALAISPLDPLRAVWYQHRSTAYLQEEDDKNALDAAHAAIAANPAYPGGYLNAAVALAGLGRSDEAKAAFQKHESLRPGWTIERVKASQTVAANPASLERSARIFATLRRLGMPER